MRAIERTSSVPQDLIRDGSTKPLHEDAITRVARCIFAYRWPNALWDDASFKSERDDCILLAAQFREIFNQPWTLFDAAPRLTEQSIHLCYGTRTLTNEHRAAVQSYAESYIEDLVKVFGGDARHKNGGDLYQPQDEPEHDTLEVVDPKKAVN